MRYALGTSLRNGPLKTWLSTFLSGIFLAVLGGCAAPGIDTTYTAVSQDSRVQFLVLHFTSTDFANSLDILARGPVSSHYLVRDDPPTVYRLVDENRRAFHAGESAWQGYTQLNAASIGIEIVNRGYEDTPSGRVWLDYPSAQVDAVIKLAREIVERHRIPPERVVGHSDVAPLRKLDPGPRFPWKRLAEAGLVPWPDAARVAGRRTAFEVVLPSIPWFQAKLAAIGYHVPQGGELDEDTRGVLAAFQMKYRPARFDGEPDAETAAMLDVLTDP